jgi:tetratricopeptide (TPR) repeat protein
MQLRKSFFALLILALALASCSGSKQLADKEQEEEPGKLDPKMQVSLERRFIDAIREKHLGNYEEAVKLFEEVTRRDPNNDAAHYELAQLYYGSGLYELALDHSKRASTIDPANKWYQLLLADIYASIYKFEEAAEVYGKIVDKFPEEYDLYLDWAFMHMKAGDNLKAIKAYNELEKKVGVDESISFQKQSLYLKENMLPEAVAEIEKLIEEYPDNPNFYGVLAEMYEVNGEPEKAVEAYNRLLEVDPDNASALMAAAKIAYNNGDREEYFRLMKNAISNPDQGIDSKIMVLYTYIEHYEKRKDEWPQALELADALVEAHPENAKSYAIRGDLYYLDDQNAKALEDYHRSLEYEEGVYNVWQQILLIEGEMQDFEALLRDAEAAIARFPNQAIPNFFLAVAQDHFKDFDKATRSYDRALMMSRNNPTLQAQIYSNLGDLYHTTGNHQASDSCYSASLDIDPDNPYVLNNYAYYLSLRKDKLDEAEKMSKRSNELEPGNASFQDTYAWILYQQGDYKKAKDWIEKSIENSEDPNSVLLEHYGDILYQLGDVDAAVVQWNKALDAGGDAELIGRKIADRKLYE